MPGVDRKPVRGMGARAHFCASDLRAGIVRLLPVPERAPRYPDRWRMGARKNLPGLLFVLDTAVQ